MDHNDTNSGAVAQAAMRKRESVWREGVSAKAALVVAHPGHELRVYDWLQTARPDVHVLTNGSRASLMRARREASAAFISRLGCRIAPVWQGIPDSTLYAHLLAQDHAPFFDWVSRLASDLVERDIDLVVADAWQYYNITHDLTHLMARVAAAEASVRLGRDILVLEFQVVPAALAPTAPRVQTYCSKSLTAAVGEAKRAAAHAFPDIEGEIAEIEALEGARAYTVEQFFTPAALSDLRASPIDQPPYEIYGEARVAAGLYQHVLRWRHAAPLIRALVDRHERAPAAGGRRVSE